MGRTIAEILKTNRSTILREMRRSFHEISDIPYKEVLLNTEDGRKRLRYWVNLAIDALDGEPETFYTDQTHIGYRRAVEGYSLADVAKVHKFYMKNVLRLVRNQGDYSNPPAAELLDDLQELSEIAFEGIRLVAQSFIATREEIIAEKIGLLQQLHSFTQKIMNTFEKDEIAQLTTHQLIQTFGADGCILAIYGPDSNPRIYRHPADERISAYMDYLEKAWRKNTCFYMDEGEDILTKILDKTAIKRLVIMPISGRENRHGVVMLFHLGAGFKFTEIEQELLQQFLYITSMVLENSYMVEEIERNSLRLRRLNRRTIDISEQERKRLSEDIHDTLTQTLTGISFKLQFCHHIGCNRPALLKEEIANLITTTRGAIDQSREIIASLHPDIIDNIGLVSALERLIAAFESKHSISVKQSLPDTLYLPSRITICIYRVVQEALTNIYKHASARNVKLVVKQEKGFVRLSLADDGRGFQCGTSPGPMVDAGKYGLFYMQQRVEYVGGKLTIFSELGRTEIRAQIPLQQNGAMNDDHQNFDSG